MYTLFKLNRDDWYIKTTDDISKNDKLKKIKVSTSSCYRKLLGLTNIDSDVDTQMIQALLKRSSKIVGLAGTGKSRYVK
jgi:hypothetical protein